LIERLYRTQQQMETEKISGHREGRSVFVLRTSPQRIDEAPK
jgi:hypothetical protein